MRIVVTLLVRDEIDVLAATIEHYLAAGADHLIVTDNGSVDGTVELLQRYRRAGVLDLIHEPEHNYDQSRWVTRMARQAADRHRADWVINADADEFLWPCVPSASGRLQLTNGPTVDLAAILTEIPDDVGTIIARRQNLLADPEAVGGWPKRLIWREEVSRSERGTPIGAKAIHRADPEVVVAVGNHAAQGPLIGRTLPGEPLVVVHVPDRGYPQFERKIANGGTSLANSDLSPDVGWHWRTDHDRLTTGQLHEIWRTRQLDRAEIDRRRAAGDLTLDTRLHTRIDHLVAQAVLPDALELIADTERGTEGNGSHPGRRGWRRLPSWRQRQHSA